MTRADLLRLEAPFGLLGFVLVALAVTFAQQGIPGWIPPAAITRAGIPSPLAGMTRSFVSLAAGDAGRAFWWHPLGPLAFAVSAAAPLVAAVSLVRGRRIEALARLLSRRAFWAVVVLAVAAVWVRQAIVLDAS